jgi:small subunit ribosomal protein S2
MEKTGTAAGTSPTGAATITTASGTVTATIAPRDPAVISVKTLLDAGAHFGHQTQRWNPKMLPYIFCARNGIHIINLDSTLQLWERAKRYIIDQMALGGNMLFVGTKPSAKECVEREARRSESHFVTTRWLGGMLSNFDTIRNSTDRMRKLEEFLAKAETPDSKINLNKREKLTISRQLAKLEASLGGIRQMRKLPEIMFVVDIIKEEIAVAEARRMRIPVVALVDTNTDPNAVDFPIPANDDATRTLQLFVAAVADAVIEGKAIYRERMPKDKDEQARGSENKDINGSFADTALGASAAQAAT